MNKLQKMIKKKDYNTSVEMFFNKNLIKNFKKGALLKVLIKSTLLKILKLKNEKFFNKNLIKNFKKVPY